MKKYNVTQRRFPDQVTALQIRGVHDVAESPSDLVKFWGRIRSVLAGGAMSIGLVVASFGQTPAGLTVNAVAPTRSGETISPLQVRVVDGNGNVVTGSSISITLSLAAASGFSLSGTLTQAATNGVATFSSLSLSGTCPGLVGLTISAPGLPVLQSQLALSASTLYVSSATGSDSACGTSSAPFFSISHAAALVSPVSSSGGGGTTVYIAGGTYREAGAIIPATSGNANGAITFTHWPGDSNPVLIDGADRVTGWVPASTADGLNSTVQGVYKAPITPYTYPNSSNPIDPPDYSQQVFIDGRMLPEAQYPHNVNHGTTWISNPAMIAMQVNSIVGNDATYHDTVTISAMPETMLTDPLNTIAGTLLTPTLARGTDNYWAGAVVHFIAGQGLVDGNGNVTDAGGFGNASSGIVTNSVANTNALTMTIWQNPNGSNPTQTNSAANPPTVHNAALDISSGSPFYITGVLSELSNYDEWEIVGSTLYLAPQLGHNPDASGHLVEIKHRPYAFDLSNVSYITISNINLFATSIYTTSASTNITLDTIHAEYVSHFTNFYPTYVALPNPAANSDFTLWSPGWRDSGIVIAGANSVIQNSTIEYSAGNGLYIRGDNVQVNNNIIHDVAYAACFCAGVETGTRKVSATNSSYTPNALQVTRNTMYNAAGALIQPYGVVGGTFTNNELWAAVTHARDMGAFYTNRNFNASTIAYNIIRNINYPNSLNSGEGQVATHAIPYAVNAGAGIGTNKCTTQNYNNTDTSDRKKCDIPNDGKGIYLDQGTSRWIVHHNLVFGSDWGIYNNYLASGNVTIGTALFAYNNTVNNTNELPLAALNNPFIEGEFDPTSGVYVAPYYLETGGNESSNVQNNLFGGFTSSVGTQTPDGVNYPQGNYYVFPSTNPTMPSNSDFVGPILETQNLTATNTQSISAFQLAASGAGIGEGACVAPYTAASCPSSYATDLGAFPSSPSALGYGWTAGSSLCTKDSSNLYCSNITALSPGVTTGPTGMPPTLSLNPGTANFPQTVYGSTASAVNIAIANTGGTAATLSAVTVTGDFSISANTCGVSIAPGAGCAVSVVFTPTATGTRSGTFTVTDQSGSLTVPLSGVGSQATLYLTPTSVSRPFDVANPAFTATYSGFVNGDTSSVVNGSYILMSPATRVSSAGSYSISPSGNLTAANYSIVLNSGTLQITGSAPQAILFTALPNVGHPTTLSLTAQATSGLPVTFTVSGTAGATLTGNSITVNNPGSVVVMASQAGNSNYAPATSVIRSFTAQ